MQMVEDLILGVSAHNFNDFLFIAAVQVLEVSLREDRVSTEQEVYLLLFVPFCFCCIDCILIILNTRCLT
jgi:hypothetical protein